ncbi:MAG: PhzF family phenazine biosynthesis protein [Casimicrobiaceae bacterium]
MSDYAFRLVNVFAEAALAGNPLCVFEDARGLDDATMQALALQFNLSETTFILPSERATAQVRIFTPTFEMPFAGHPTLGTAHVVRAVRDATDAVTLEMKAGIIPVIAQGNVWTLRANPPRHRAASATRDALAAALGLEGADLADTPPLWVDTGSEQLVVPLASVDAVRRAAPSAEGLQRHASNGTRALAYVWAYDTPPSSRGTEVFESVVARFFFLKYGAVVEDPGTGSACANLGGWLLATGSTKSRRIAVSQGDGVGRPCRLFLEVTADAHILVSGRVVELGRGTITL